MSSLIKQLIPTSSLKYFTPASAEVNWTRINTLVHGPGAGEDKRSANSAVFACLMAIATSYPEPPLSVFREIEKDKTEKLPDHPLQDLLDAPTPAGELSMDEMLFWTAWAKHIDGNAYWIKVRSGNAETGNVIQLWPISPTLMEPVTLKDSRGRAMDWISFYKYQIAANETVQIPVENVIHFRWGVDDRDMRKGLAGLKALVRQISTDDEADRFVAALLKNYAVPGLVVMPAAPNHIDEDKAEELRMKLRQKFGSDERGNIAVLSRESKVEQFGFSPKDLDMSILHRIPEERISAVMGVPAIVAGLGAGLERSTYSNSREMAEWFTERKLVPQWRADAKKLNTSLKPDFTSDKRIKIGFDLTDIRALQEDEDKKYTRLKTATGKPFMKRNEARSEIGLDPIDGWDDADEGAVEVQPISAATQPGQGQPQPNQNGNTNGRQPEQRSIDLDKWRRKALKSLAKGKQAAVNFESDEIPETQVKYISEQLQNAATDEDVEAVFKAAEVEAQPDYMNELKRTNEYLDKFLEIAGRNGH